MTVTALYLLAALAAIATAGWMIARFRKKTIAGLDHRPPVSEPVIIPAGIEQEAPVMESLGSLSPIPETVSCSGEGTGVDWAIQDIVDLNLLQQVLDVFVRATGLASVVTDVHGAPLTSLANFSDFCMKHTRGTRKGSQRCQLNDAQGGMEATKTGKPVVYYCHAGLVDFAVPLIVRGKQLGTWLGGQVLPCKPDEKKFRQIAREIGTNENEYIQDLRKIRIIPKEQIDALAELLSLIANALLQVGYARRITEAKAAELSDKVIRVVGRLSDGVVEISEPSKKLEGMMKQVTAVMRETTERANSQRTELARLEATMREIERASRVISDKLKQINEKSDAISGIIGSITKVADQTNLLSLNAEIEAERAGQYGLGFNVVAGEIRRLADQTAVSTLDIENTVNEMHAVVSSGVTQTDGFIADVRSGAREAVIIGGQLKEVVDQVQVLLPRFEEVGEAVSGQMERTGELCRSMECLSGEIHEAIDLVARSFSAVDQVGGEAPCPRRARDFDNQ